MCASGAEVETTEHVILRCLFYWIELPEIFDNLEKANSELIWVIKIKSHLHYIVQKQMFLKILIKISKL